MTNRHYLYKYFVYSYKFVFRSHVMVNSVKNETLLRIVKNQPQLATPLRVGDLVKAKVLEKTGKTLYLDLDRFGTGIVYGTEYLNARQTIKNLKTGVEVSAKVVEPENEDGYVELSLAEAHKQRSWDEVKEIKDRDEIIKVKIAGRNSGGLITVISGIAAFLPVSHLASEHYPRVAEADRSKIAEELQKLVGSELSVKIIDLNSRSNKLIISEREAVEEGIKGLVGNYQVGQTVDGVISGIADFGAFVRFVDNPKVEGLIHLSELDHRLIDSPKEVVKVDELVKVKIIDIKEGRISLSLKALKPDPWQTVQEKYQAGQTIKGTVHKFNPFGAFISLDSEIQGLIHVSEFGGVEEMKSKLTLGETYEFMIDSLKPEEKRLILKMKK